jgi:hypothetical protein
MTTRWKISAKTWAGEVRVFIGFSREEALRWWGCQRDMLHAPELEELTNPDKETPRDQDHH